MHFTSSFRSRLIAILVVINLCVLLLGIASYYFLGELSGRLELFTKGMYHRLEIATKLLEAADARAIAVRNIALHHGSEQFRESLVDYERQQQQTERALDELQQAASAYGLPTEVIHRIDLISQVERRYSPVAASIVEMLKAGRRDDAILRIRSECSPALKALSRAIHDYLLLTEQRTRVFVLETASTTRWQRRALSVISLSSLSLAMILGWQLFRSVRKTLGAEPEELNAYLRDMARGNLEMPQQRGTVIAGSLLDTVAEMKSQMRTVVERVRRASTAIAIGAHQIAHGSVELQDRAESQAGNLHDTSTAMLQMNRQVQLNAMSTEKAVELVAEVSKMASSGGDAMQKVTHTMDAISRSSEQIGEIIGVIDSIAFQTNILALNAAVEAARAGDQGRGFAVVASEVRMLAHRTSEAAQQVKALVANSVTKVEVGSCMVDDAGQAVDQVVSEVQRVATLMDEVGKSVREQSEGLAGVSSSLSALNQHTQQHSELANASAVAAAELRQQSEQLEQVVSYFKL